VTPRKTLPPRESPLRRSLPALRDIHSERDTRRLALDRAGVKGLRYPICVLDRQRGQQHTVAEIDMSVSVPQRRKGAHMSRFVELLNKHRREIDIRKFRSLCAELRKDHDAEAAHVTVRFPYFIEKTAPVSGERGLVDYACTFGASVSSKGSDLWVAVDVPVTSLCPCSKAISKHGAHNQRSLVSVRVWFAASCMRCSSVPTKNTSPSERTSARASSKTWCGRWARGCAPTRTSPAGRWKPRASSRSTPTTPTPRWPARGNILDPTRDSSNPPCMLLLLLSATFLNGVNIDGLRSQSFEKCKTVRIDDRGDVHLECSGYEVQAQAPAPVTPAPVPAAVPIVPSAPSPSVALGSLAAPPAVGPISKHYWLVSEETPGAQYDLDVFVNSKWVRRVKAGEPQIVLEVTRYLAPGPNKVLFAATKHLESGRKSVSPASFLKITVGEGESAGNTVMIDNPLVECKRTAAETENVNEEFTIQGR